MKRLLVCFIVFGISAYAVTQVEVNQSINGLMNKIDQINQDLQQKQQKQNSLDKAIKDSNAAIGQSEKLLRELREKRNLDVEQLTEIATVLPQIESATKETQIKVKNSIAMLYQQTKQLNSNSILSGGDFATNQRKQSYIAALLKVEQDKYQKLQAKLNELSSLNAKLSQEVQSLSAQLGSTAKQKQSLISGQQAKLSQAEDLQDQISSEQQQLSGLKQKQAELNRLLIALKPEVADEPKSSYSTKSNRNSDNQETDQFFSNKLAKPLNAKVAIAYGAMRHGVRNNGVLYNATNIPVFSIAAGTVMYASVLPGFGNVVVISHGDNYMSVYGGVVLNVNKGQVVKTGQIIAHAGTLNNQPMGGVYFELRHFGQPVNPGELVN